MIPIFFNSHIPTQLENEYLFPKIELVQNVNQVNQTLSNYVAVDNILNFPAFDYKSLIDKVTSSFISQLAKKSDVFSTFSPEIVLSVFIYTVVKLLKLNPSNIAIELTSSKSFFFVAKHQNYSTHIEIFLLDKDKPKVHLVSNIYAQEEHLYSNDGSLEETISYLENILPRPFAYYNNFDLSTYELSCCPVTEYSVQAD